MTPKEFHEACHAAIQECPQFHGYDDDMYIDGWGEFGNIPKKGWVAVIRFWKEEPLLWESGYDQALPEDVQELFDKVEKLLDAAIKEAVK